MESPSPACDESLLESLLKGELRAEVCACVESHLEHCSACRGALDSLAATPHEWSEAREQLSDFAATIWFQIGLWQAVLINGAFVRRVSRTRGLGMSAVLTRGMTTESAD